MGQLNVNGSLDVTGNATLKSDVLMNSDFGSATQGYAIRAWISFDANGTNQTRGSGNATMTDHGTGDFTMNFTTAMSDANYAVIGEVGYNDSSINTAITSSGTHQAPTTTTMRFCVGVNYNSSLSDERYISIAIVR